MFASLIRTSMKVFNPQEYFMKTIDAPFTCSHSEKTVLKPLVSQLVKNLLPWAVRNKSFIVNDVPAEFNYLADSDPVIQVLTGLFNTFITYASDSCIRISAEKMFGNMVQVTVQDNNSNHTYAVACALQKVVPLAEKLGGHLNISNRRQKITTISFIFPEASEQVVLSSLRGAA
jgi:hypothetical protein